jgi:hypothetical protein
MVFQNSDDLVYPNLVNCQIASNALVFATNDALPPPPPPISTSTAESLLNKSPAVKYDFIVEKKILAREKERVTGILNHEVYNPVRWNRARWKSL